MITKQRDMGFQIVGLIAFSQIKVTIHDFKASSSSKLYSNISFNLLTENIPPLSLIRHSKQFVAKRTITAASECLTQHVCP